MACAICETRKPKRACPGVNGDICTQCCAEKREETIDCPLHCEHLLEGRKHQRLAPLGDAAAVPHPEVKITDDFLDRNDLLLRFLSVAIRDAALATAGATDADLREAIDASIRTLKTADSGLIYESRPDNPFASAIQEKLNAQIEDLRKQIAERAGMPMIRDKDVLGSLVFLIRVAVALDNGRRKCRAFYGMLVDRYPPPKSQPARTNAPEPGQPASNLIITG